MTHPIEAQTLDLIEETLHLARNHAKVLMTTKPDSAQQVLDDSDKIMAKIETARQHFTATTISRDFLIAVIEAIGNDIPTPEGYTEEMIKTYRRTLKKLSDKDMEMLALMTQYHVHGNFKVLGGCVALEIRRFFEKELKNHESVHSG